MRIANSLAQIEPKYARSRDLEQVLPDIYWRNKSAAIPVNSLAAGCGDVQTLCARAPVSEYISNSPPPSIFFIANIA